MKTLMQKVSGLLMICFCLCGSVQAEHDSGQGKSQDGNDYTELGSVAVAPEPSTLLIFGLGSLGLVAASRQRTSKNQSEES